MMPKDERRRDTALSAGAVCGNMAAMMAAPTLQRGP